MENNTNLTEEKALLWDQQKILAKLLADNFNTDEDVNEGIQQLKQNKDGKIIDHRPFSRP